MIQKEARYRFGGKLREIRERKGVTLRELALQAGISESMLSQIERNRVSPSIDTLMRIVDLLAIDMEYLFRDFRKPKRLSVIRREQRRKIETDGVRYEELSLLHEPGEEHAVEAFLLVIDPERERGNREYGHPGREMGILLSGEGEIEYGGETVRLREGDTVAFRSDAPHTLRCTGTEPLRAIWIITPPRMLFPGNETQVLRQEGPRREDG